MARICTTTTAPPYKGVVQVVQCRKDPQAHHCTTLHRYTFRRWCKQQEDEAG